MKIQTGVMPFRGYQTYYRIVGDLNSALTHHYCCYMAALGQRMIILKCLTNLLPKQAGRS